MLKIGITGGIGSGKTTVCKIIECLGFPVYYADDRARGMLDNEPGIHEQLKERFGGEVFRGGSINRKKLAEKVFKDPLKLVELNSIIHPYVKTDHEQWLKEQSTSLAFSEAAIYFETGRNAEFDKMILVVAPEELRIKRVMKRSGIGEDEVRKRMENQWEDTRKIPLADYVIVNDEQLSLIAETVGVAGLLRREFNV